ncbi:MAG: hypothetical protein ACOC2Q_01695 [Spirochaetota bacterium]
MRTRRLVLIILFALLAGATAFAQTSVGIILGEPTGLSGKQWIGEGASLDLAVAWSFVPEGAFYLHVDYQQHFDDLDIDVGSLLWFAGIGPRIYIGNDVGLGLRIPVGLVYDIDDVPLEVFLELAPGLNLFPSTVFNFGGGIGVRYQL